MLIAVVGFEDGRMEWYETFTRIIICLLFCCFFLFGNNHSTSSRESSGTSSCDNNGNIFLIIDVAYRKWLLFLVLCLDRGCPNTYCKMQSNIILFSGVFFIWRIKDWSQWSRYDNKSFSSCWCRLVFYLREEFRLEFLILFFKV